MTHTTAISGTMDLTSSKIDQDDVTEMQARIGDKIKEIPFHADLDQSGRVLWLFLQPSKVGGDSDDDVVFTAEYLTVEPVRQPEAGDVVEMPPEYVSTLFKA